MKTFSILILVSILLKNGFKEPLSSLLNNILKLLKEHIYATSCTSLVDYSYHNT